MVEITELKKELQDPGTWESGHTSLGFSLCSSLIFACLCFHSAFVSQVSCLSYPNVKNFASFSSGLFVIPREGFIWPYLVMCPLLDSSYTQGSGQIWLPTG